MAGVPTKHFQIECLRGDKSISCEAGRRVVLEGRSCGSLHVFDESLTGDFNNCNRHKLTVRHGLKMRALPNSIDFGEFLMVIKEQKLASAAAGDESDTILAFQALGGNADKSGFISADRLRKTCKVYIL
eukprot:SAG31_NODE_2201_length_6201_cov_14.443461_4_plen_129_part_00